jgi:hypothetical protein
MADPTSGPTPAMRSEAMTHNGKSARGGLRFSWWNLLLLLPLLMLITAWFNKDGPRLFGLPFFYWYQLAFVFVGVACVSVVYVATKHFKGGESPPGGAASTRPTRGNRDGRGGR